MLLPRLDTNPKVVTSKQGYSCTLLANNGRGGKSESWQGGMTLLFVNCKNPSSLLTLVIQNIDTETALQKFEVVIDSSSLTKIL